MDTTYLRPSRRTCISGLSARHRWTSMVSHRCEMNVGAKRHRGRATKTCLNGVAPTSAIRGAPRHNPLTDWLASPCTTQRMFIPSSFHDLILRRIPPRISSTFIPSAPPDLYAPVPSPRSWLSPARPPKPSGKNVNSSLILADDALTRRWPCPKQTKEKPTALAAAYGCATAAIGVSYGPQHLHRLRNCEDTR